MGTTSAQVSPSNLPKQLSDGNALGVVTGQSPTDLVGFYGGPNGTAPNVPGGIAQPPSQGSVKGIPGTVSVAAVTVTVASVAPNTTNEQAFTVTGAAVGQVVAVQKPTVDAGIAIVGARASATNSIAITVGNDTAATVTPTAAQTYTFEIIPAAMVISATLTPAAVAPNAFTEQQFNVGGIGSGVLIVNKPTAQTGLGIVDARVVSPGVVGITFANFTAATITPTAGESYLFFSAPEIQIAPVMKTLAVTLTPVSVAANTTAEQTFTVTGLPASSQVVVNKPSNTVGLGLGGARVSALNTLALNFINNTSAAITPPSEVYTIALFPAPAPAAGSTTSYNAAAGGSLADHAALVGTGFVAGP
jgi:hypothetical protein